MRYVWVLIGLTVCGVGSGSAWAITDPLNAQVRFALPDSVRTVGQAYTYFLAPSAYHITTLPPASPQASRGFRTALPFPLPVQEVLTIKKALLAVTPMSWSVVIDQEHLLISLTPAPSHEGED